MENIKAKFQLLDNFVKDYSVNLNRKIDEKSKL